MKVAIFTEATKTSGLGHLSRCLSLLSEFISRNIYTALFLETDMHEQLKVLLKNYNYKYCKWINNEKFIVEIKNKYNFDVAIVDSYNTSETFLRKLSHNFKICVFMDDTNRINYPKGMIINFSINANEIVLEKNTNNLYLLGKDYVLLGNKIKDIKVSNLYERIKSRKISIVLKSTSLKTTLKSIKYVLTIFRNMNIIVFNIENNLNFYEYKKIKIYPFQSQEIFWDTLKDSFLVISSSGMILHELAYLNLVTIPFLISDNQNEGYKKFNFVEKYINPFKNSWEKIFLQYLVKIKYNYPKYYKMAQKGREIVDGKGAKRIIDEIIKHYKGTL